MPPTAVTGARAAPARDEALGDIDNYNAMSTSTANRQQHRKCQSPAA